MLHRLALAAALALAALSMPAEAQVPRVLDTCGTANQPVGPGGWLAVDKSGNLCTTGGGGGGGGGSVTANQGAAGTSPWPMVIYQGGNPLAVGNPIFVQVTNPMQTGTVTPGGTPGTQAQAVQGIPNGVPQNVVAQDAVVPTGYPATITATGPLPGFRTTGSNSVMFSVTGTAAATVQFSLDSTNGTDGTWNSYAAGQYTKDNTYFYTNDQAVLNGNFTESTAVFPSNGTVWLRANVSSFSAGATIGAWLRSQPYVQRNVGQRALTTGTNVIGGVQSASTFSEAFRTALAANATQTGATRDLGATVERYARFGAVVVSDQAGSLQIQTSTDGTNWITVATQAVAANTPVDVSMPIRARYHRAVFINGATATGANGFSLLTSFTAG